MVAGAAYGTALLVGLIVAFAGAKKLDAVSALWAGLIQAGNAFGPDTIIYPSDDFGGSDYSANIGQFPLLATFLALGVAAYLFRRVTARYTSATAALFDAGRAAVILSLLVLVTAILITIVDPSLKGYDDGDGSGFPGPPPAWAWPTTSRTSASPGSIFLPALLLFVVLAIVVFMRRDWLSEKLAHGYDWLAAPFAGIAAVVVSLFAAGLIYLIAILIGEKDTRGFAEVVRLLAILPALGMRLLGLGVFSKFGTTSDGDDELTGDEGDSWDRLGDFADDHGALFWISPLDRDRDRRVRCLDRGEALGRQVHGAAQRRGLRGPAADRAAVPDPDLQHPLRHRGGGRQGELRRVVLRRSRRLPDHAPVLPVTLVVGAVFLTLTGNLDVDKLKSKASSFQNNQQGYGQQGYPQQGYPQQGWPVRRPAGRQ